MPPVTMKNTYSKGFTNFKNTWVEVKQKIIDQQLSKKKNIFSFIVENEGKSQISQGPLLKNAH